MLKPETSSDSASLKSKGARWVSAKVQTTQTGKKNQLSKEDWEKQDFNLKEHNKKTTKTNKVLKTDS